MNDLNNLHSDEPIGFVRQLLLLVSRGHVAIAELHRLADLVPEVFRLSNRADQQRYSDLLPDFTYFANVDQFERRIEQQASLQKVDEELRSNYGDLLQQFYSLFERIQQYVFDLRRLLDEIDGSDHVHQTLEMMLSDFEGRQLLCESVYVCGLLLFILDFKLCGPLRERLLVAHFRYAAQQTKSECNVEDVCKLIRSTGFVAAVVESGILVTPARRPALYPVEYFRRAQLCPNHLHLIVGRLRSDDLYNQIAVYPMPNQRSTALTSQAAILFVVLFFVPDTLTNENAIMREVSDKFFSDNHVLSVHMGLVFNLVDAWDSFRAAKSALGNALDSTRLRRVAAQHGANMQTQSDQIRSWLTEGTLTERSVLMHSHKLFALIRETNVSLRWTLLHTHTPTGGVELSGSSGRKQRQLRDTIVAEIKFDPATVLDLLLSVAQLEQSVERIYRLLCKNRTTAWNQHRMECYDRSIELSEVFAGKRPLTRIDCNVKLEQWFGQFATQLKSLELDGDDCEVSVQKIVKLSRALQQVREFRQLESHAQVKQHLTECDLALQSMLKINCIGDTFLQNLNVVCDLSYAWEIIRSYTSHMQTQIHKDANLVIKLRAVFLKLASALDVPLLRIHQANADELQHVSQFYSSELVRYVRDVLHVIPETLFRHMNAIVQLQTDTIKVLPTYVRRDQLSSYAQSNERLEVAHLTHSISLLTQGLLSMRSTLFGVIRIDASRILEDGIRRELVKQLSNAFHSTFTFAPKQRPAELARRLERLHMQMDGYRRSFEYMQDYVCVYGLKIWQEELNRVLNYHVEQECNPFLARKVLDWESLYQNSHIPIPLQRSAESGVITFVGQLVKEMIRITDPKYEKLNR